MYQLELGKAAKAKTPVSISLKERKQGTYVIGTTGTGKSTFLKNVIYQLRESGLIAETNKGDQLLPARNPSAIAAIEIFDAMESGPTHPGEHPRAEAVIDKMHQGRRTSLEGLTLEILIEDASNDGGAFSISTVEADG